MSEIHLLNCCKCGENGAPKLISNGLAYLVECAVCDKVATPKFTTPEEAVAWWNGYNTNPPQETTKLKLLEAKDALKTLADYTATHFPEDCSCDEMAAIAYKAHEKLKEIEVNHSEDERIAEPLTNGDRLRAMSNIESRGECDLNREANAALIAAAPEMYEALEFSKKEFHDLYFENCCEYIESVLKKARGEE